MTIIASRWSVTWIELKSNFIIEKVFGEFNRIFIYYRFDLHFCQFLENWSLLLWWLTKFSRSLHHENQSYSWNPKYFITKNICLIKPETNDFSFFAKDYCQHEAQMRGLLSLLMENLSVRDDYCSNSVVKVAGGWWVVFPLISPVLPAHATPIKTNCKAIKTVYWVITNGELRLLQTRGSHKKENWFFELFILPQTTEVYCLLWNNHKILGEPFCIIIWIISVRNL